MASGKWRDDSVPKVGWACIDYLDLGREPKWTCEMCEAREIRHVHVMRHAGYSSPLACGRECAAKMEQDAEAPARRVAEMKTEASLKKKWPRLRWHPARSGNPYVNVDDFNVVVFRRGARWCGRVEHRRTKQQEYATAEYVTEEAAKAAMFEVLLKLRHRHVVSTSTKPPGTVQFPPRPVVLPPLPMPPTLAPPLIFRPVLPPPKEFWGVGLLRACPRCGAGTDKIKSQRFFDDERDDEYVGCECTVCGWQDEGTQL